MLPIFRRGIVVQKSNVFLQIHRTFVFTYSFLSSLKYLYRKKCWFYAKLIRLFEIMIMMKLCMEHIETHCCSYVQSSSFTNFDCCSSFLTTETVGPMPNYRLSKITIVFHLFGGSDIAHISFYQNFGNTASIRNSCFSGRSRHCCEINCGSNNINRAAVCERTPTKEGNEPERSSEIVTIADRVRQNNRMAKQLCGKTTRVAE